MDIRTQGFHTHPEYIPGIEHNLDGHKNPVSFLNNYNNRQQTLIMPASVHGNNL